ncbi:MAG: hypothetical protein IJW12_02205 [Opitutales bacterium]|nr:hypothetical protein [Opitutales bacterium]
MNNTYYGKTGDLIIADIQYTDALDEVPSGTITCTFPGTIAEAIAAAPELGSSTEHLPESSYDSLGATVHVRLVLKNRIFSGGKDGSVTVTLKYGFREEDANSTDAQPTSYQVQGTISQTSILLHPRYKDVPESEKALANALISGTKPYESVYVKDNEIKTRLSSEDKAAKNDNGWKQKTLEDAIKSIKLSELGAELIEKIQKGIHFYFGTGCEFVETSYSTAMQTGINHLGKISMPPGAAPNGGSWLLSNIEATKERGESRWKIQKKWKSADSGAEWDEELYGD